MCFSKIINVVKDYDTLIDRFLLEIARCVLSSLKMCHNSLELSQDVMEKLLSFVEVYPKVNRGKSQHSVRQKRREVSSLGPPRILGLLV